jgi:hypothetical protein
MSAKQQAGTLAVVATVAGFAMFLLPISLLWKMTLLVVGQSIYYQTRESILFEGK